MTKTGSKPAASPDDLLKAAVSGGDGTKPGAASRKLPAWARLDARALRVSGVALCAGALLGAGLTVLSGAGRARGQAVAGISSAVNAGRAETARLGGDIAQLHQILADLRATVDAARKDGTQRHAALNERIAQGERAVSAKVATLGDRIDQAEREQGARIAGLTAQIDRRAAASVPKVEAARPEPTQTGSLADTRGSEAAEQKVAAAKAPEAKVPEVRIPDAKAAEAKKSAAPEKPAVIDGWALRDVYDGAAIIENRRRRLVEVAPGDVLPGVGRVDGVERRGREWVVVTRQGLITPQPW